METARCSSPDFLAPPHAFPFNRLDRRYLAIIMSTNSVSYRSIINMPPANTRRASTRTDQRDATRRDLVQAGLRLVSERGLAGATTAAIAQASGRAHGTVFVHFPTRDALVAEIVEEMGRSMSARLAETDIHTPSVSDVLDAHLAALAERESLYACLLREATSLPPGARARLFALQTGIAWRLRAALAREVAAKTARAIDPVALANIWIALTNHYLINRDLFAPGASVIAARGAELKAQLLSIIQP
jgi:AcrR family transcriptional regulator